MKLALIPIVVLSTSCMTITDAKGHKVRKVDPEARKFYGTAAVKVIGHVLYDSLVGDSGK